MFSVYSEAVGTALYYSTVLEYSK